MQQRNALLSILLSTYALLICLPGYAQTTGTGYEGAWYIGGGYLGLDSAASDPQGISSGGFSVEAGYGGVFSNHLQFNLGIYRPFFSDDDEFSQRVKDQFGHESTEDSDIFAWGLLAEAGYRFNLNEATDFSLSAGLRSLSAERQINGCTNCYNEGLSLDGGAYLRPAVIFHLSNFDMEIAAMTFFSGDMSNGIMLNFVF